MDNTELSQARERQGEIERLFSKLAALEAERQQILSGLAAGLDTGGCPEWCNVSDSPSDFARRNHAWHAASEVLRREHWGLRPGAVRNSWEFMELDGSRRFGPVNRSRTAPPGYMPATLKGRVHARAK